LANTSVFLGRVRAGPDTTGRSVAEFGADDDAVLLRSVVLCEDERDTALPAGKRRSKPAERRRWKSSTVKE
jgi:hypothetical protein